MDQKATAFKYFSVSQSLNVTCLDVKNFTVLLFLYICVNKHYKVTVDRVVECYKN